MSLVLLWGIHIQKHLSTSVSLITNELLSKGLYGYSMGLVSDTHVHLIFPLFGRGNVVFGLQGIPNGSRARPVLFQKDTLQKSTAAYPSIGQKKLNGAASRMMINFAMVIAAEIHAQHPTETNRPELTNV